MTITLQKISLFLLILLLVSNANSQDTTTTDFFDKVKAYDLSTILMADSIVAEDIEGGKEKIKRAEILGFIGDDYQRLYIHFISIIQNPTNPYEYLAFGKTKVKETVCSFQGRIRIRQARVYKSADLPNYMQGFAACDVVLYEDQKQPSTGFFTGKLTSNFIIDNYGQFRYDALMFVADGFRNNQFVGTWTSYKTNTIKKANWGDYRIPESGDLDMGAGEFGVNEKYVKNGWLTYMLENMIPNGAIEKTEVDPKIEKKNWWE